MNLQQGVLCALVFIVSLLGTEAQNVTVTDFTRATNGSVQVQVNGAAGMVFSFQTSSDLANWRTLDFTNSPDGNAAFTDNYVAPTNTGGGNRYYRIRQDAPNTTVTVTNYHGWTNCLILRNSTAEVDIVPAVGRIMQFRFLGQTNGPFWENTNMFGVQPSATSWNTAGSFGGDKVWPSPQSWPWPPPRAFDSLAFTGAVVNGSVTLTGPVDATSFGMREVRYISLSPTEPILHVTSTFEKSAGANVTAGVWSVTQMQDAQRVFIPVPQDSVFPTNYLNLPGYGSPPPGLTVSNGFVSFVRPTGSSPKVGNDAGAVMWVGTNYVLLMESPRIPGVPKSGYPDSGCSAEVYCNQNPTPYIEMEILAPLVNFSTTNINYAAANTVYSLINRTQPTPDGEAVKYLVR